MSQHIGHGRLGLESGLPLYDDYQRFQARRKDSLARTEASGGIINSTWFNSGSGVYAHTWDQNFGGKTLDVVGVHLVDEILDRVDSGAECIAQEGTFCFVKNPGGTLQLSVHLAGGANPSGRNVMILTAFHDATGAERREHLVHPELGRQKFADGELAEWNKPPTELLNWESVMDDGWELSQDDPIEPDGVWSAKISGGNPIGSGRIRQSPSLVSGTLTRWYGYYRTPVDFPSAGVRVRIGSGQTLSADGRSINSTALDGLDLKLTAGKTKAYIFDFIGHETDPSFELIVYNTQAGNVSAWFGATWLQKIHCWNLHTERISADGLPEIMEGGTDVFPGSTSTGAGDLRLVNGDRVLTRRFSYPFSYPSREVQIYKGGVVPGTDRALVLNEMYRSFRGRISGDRGPVVNSRFATITLESIRVILEAKLPFRRYGADFPDVESRDRNRARPLAFGSVPHTRPAGIGFVPGSPATGYRVYELCDTEDWPTGIGGATSVHAYTDENAADKQLVDQRVLLSSALGHYSQNTTAGTLSILEDVRVILITLENNRLTFDVGGGGLTIEIPPGPYIIGQGVGASAQSLLYTIASLATAAGGVTIQAIYDNVTHLVSLERTTKGDLDLYFSAPCSVGQVLGFPAEDIVAAGEGHVAEEPLFENADSSHIIRVSFDGFKDRADGLYTGTPGAKINILGTVFPFALRELLKQPASRYHAREWATAVATYEQELSIYLGGLGSQEQVIDLAAFIDRLEAGSPTVGAGPAEIELDGAGVFRIQQRTETVPAGTPHLNDDDYLEELECFFVPAEVYRFTEVRGARDPSTGAPLAVEIVEQEIAKLVFGSDKTIGFDTYLVDESDLTNAANSAAALSRAAIRHFKVVAKTKVIRVRKGSLVRLSASEAVLGLGEDALEDADFRVLTKKLNQITDRVELVVFTNIVT